MGSREWLFSLTGLVDLQCLLVSDVQQSDSVVCIDMYILFQIFSLYRLKMLSSLCYT